MESGTSVATSTPILDGWKYQSLYDSQDAENMASLSRMCVQVGRGRGAMTKWQTRVFDYLNTEYSIS